MIEVESKIKIKNPKEFRKKISKIAKYIGKQIKIDNYYALAFLKSRPKKSLRIRKKNNIYEINFKQSISYSKGVHAKKESEFTVSDINNFLGLIKDFGYKKWLKKEKKSEIYEINKNFHIELNNVKYLGWFIEIEYLTNKKKISFAKEEILKILDKLEINKKNIIKEGYTFQLWKKKHLK